KGRSMVLDPDAYGSIVVDFMRRTKTNLIYIDRQVAVRKRRGEKPHLYEVTQLINSALGVFIFPSEEILSKLIEIPLKELRYSTLKPFLSSNAEITFSE